MILFIFLSLLLGFYMFISKPLFSKNIIRKLKKLPPTFLAIYQEEQPIIESHGKWVFSNKLKIGNRKCEESVYQCEQCGARLCKFKYGYVALGDYSDDHTKYKKKTCNQLIMENVIT